MKKLPIILIFLLFASIQVSAQAVIELDPTQSMLISGKGQGQDAAINPFLFKEESVAILENIGENEFQIRIQEAKQVIRLINLEADETIRINLGINQQLYLDTDNWSKVKVDFARKAEEQ